MAGPWRIAQKYGEIDTDCWWLNNAIVDQDGRKICWMHTESTPAEEYLVAAAPDLLAALEEYRAALAELQENSFSSTAIAAWARLGRVDTRAKYALEKAKGAL